MPAYFDKVVGDKKQSDRFLWDMRHIVADRIVYDNVGGLREICHKHGLTTWFSHIDLFLEYIKRCNYMLRQGLNVADIAYFIGEDIPEMIITLLYSTSPDTGA